MRPCLLALLSAAYIYIYIYIYIYRWMGIWIEHDRSVNSSNSPKQCLNFGVLTLTVKRIVLLARTAAHARKRGLEIEDALLE